MIVFFTVCNRKQLPGAVLLGESVLTWHPEAKFIIGFADNAEIPPLPPGIEITGIDELGLSEKLRQMSSRYYDFEFIHAVRPWFARYLLKEKDPEYTLVFLTPTARIYNSLSGQLTGNKADLLLTPNILKRLPASKHIDDKRILNVGMFNSNAWIVRATDDVARWIEWWSSRTFDRAYFDLCNGMCLDQLWLNYAPVHVPGWRLIRDASWRLGLNNALLHEMLLENNRPKIEGRFVSIVDFSGLSEFHPVWSDAAAAVKRNSDWTELLREYSVEKDKRSEFRLPGLPAFGKPAAISDFRSIRKSAKSTLGKMIKMIETFDV